jgi:hypothetical protein
MTFNMNQETPRCHGQKYRYSPFPPHTPASSYPGSLNSPYRTPAKKIVMENLFGQMDDEILNTLNLELPEATFCDDVVRGFSAHPHKMH